MRMAGDADVNSTRLADCALAKTMLSSAMVSRPLTIRSRISGPAFGVRVSAPRFCRRSWYCVSAMSEGTAPRVLKWAMRSAVETVTVSAGADMLVDGGAADIAGDCTAVTAGRESVS